MPAGALRLEVTESLVMENPEQAVEILELLRGAGALLSLDDFGTGYSSLAYLQRVPVRHDQDRQGAGAGGQCRRHRLADRAVDRGARRTNSGARVVAEGVERPRTPRSCARSDCEYAQGYYYGEPMPERDILAMLRVIRKSERKLQRRGYFRTKPKPVEPPAQAAKSPGPTRKAGATEAAATPRQAAARGNGQPASPREIAEVLKAAEKTNDAPSRPKIGGDLPPGAVRLRPRNPQQPMPAAASATRPPQHPPTMPPVAAGQMIPPLPQTPLRPAAALAQQMAQAMPPGPPFQFPPPPAPPQSQPAAYQPPPQHVPPTQPPTGQPNLEGLPPAIAASIARLAGMGETTAPPAPKDTPPLATLNRKSAGQ